MHIAYNRTLINGGKGQQPNGFLQQQAQGASNQQQLQQQINYSNSTSNLTTKRDFLSPANRVQQGTTSQIQQQQQFAQQQLNQQQNQLIQQQQQQVQPLKNNFFQQNGAGVNQLDSQGNTFQGGYSILNQQQQKNQMVNKDNGQGKKQNASSQQQQQSFSQNHSSTLQQQNYHHQNQQNINGKVSPLTNNNTLNQNQQSSSLASEVRHISVDAMKNKENLQNTLQKIYYNQPSTKAGTIPVATVPLAQQQQQQNNLPFQSNSTTNLHSYQKSNSFTNQAMRPSSRDSYSASTQSSTLNSNRQQIRASISSNQLETRLQHNSYQQNLKSSNTSSSLLGQNNNNSQMKENLVLNANNTYTMPNTVNQQQIHSQQQNDPNSFTFQKQQQKQNQSGIYEQQNQISFQQTKNPHMYQSGIVQTNSQIGNHNMKRSEIIELKHSNFLNSPKYMPANGPSQYNSQIQNIESLEKKENYTLFPQSDNHKPITDDSRTGRQKSQYKETSSINNNSNIKVESTTPTSVTSQRKELQRVSSATGTNSTSNQNLKKPSNIDYKNSKNSKTQHQNDSQTPKSGDDKKINFLSDSKNVGDINQKEFQYGMNGSQSSTTLRNNFVGTSQSQYIQSRQSTVIERKTGNDKSAALFNDTKGKQAQSTIFASEQNSTTAQSKSPVPSENKKHGGESRVYSDEYQEYKKLQEKLNYLESKIMSIKTNIDSTYQKEKEEQRKESVPSQQGQTNGSSSQSRPLNGAMTGNKNSISTASVSSSITSPIQTGSQSTPQGYAFAGSLQQQKPNQESYSRGSISSPSAISDKHISINSSSNKYQNDQLAYPIQNQSYNSFSLEQNSTKASSAKNGISSSTNNLQMKNSTTFGSQQQQQQNTQINQDSNNNMNYVSGSTSNSKNHSQVQQANTQASKQTSNNPLSSFVTQVNKGSGIPLSPKTSTNPIKRNKIEEQVSSAVNYDLSNPNTTSIPKSYLNKSQQQTQQKTQEGAQSSVNSSGIKGNNTSYSKKRDEDEHDGSMPQPYYSSSTKNQSSQGKNSMILSKNNTNMQSQNSLKNSNILASPTSVAAYKQNSQSPPYIYYISPIIKAYMEPQNTTPFAGLAREHLIQTMQAINFTRMLKPASQKVIDEKKVYFAPRRDNKKTLVFDLDETLIHCNENASVPSDVILPIKFPTGEVIEAGINVRPYCMEILQELSKYYEIIVFTASHSCYANVVLDYLDPKGQYISGRLFRENCVTTDEGVYIKDLRVIQNRNMSDLVLVDNAAYSFGFQLDNGIPIIPFYDNKSDSELKHLIHFMKSIHNVKDLREVMRKFLKVGSFSEFSDPHTLIQTLFEDLLY